MTESERDLGRRWFELVWNQKKREAIAEMLTPDTVFHDAGVDTLGPEGFYSFFDRMQASFSEIHVEVEDVMADGDKICVRWLSTGRHTGDGLGIAPTGVNFRITGISVVRVAGGKMIEAWQNWDMMGLMQQITGANTAVTYIGA